MYFPAARACLRPNPASIAAVSASERCRTFALDRNNRAAVNRNNTTNTTRAIGPVIHQLISGETNCTGNCQRGAVSVSAAWAEKSSRGRPSPCPVMTDRKTSRGRSTPRSQRAGDEADPQRCGGQEQGQERTELPFVFLPFGQGAGDADVQCFAQGHRSNPSCCAGPRLAQNHPTAVRFGSVMSCPRLLAPHWM